jgi:CMP-N,N'-diacetyllegionaminic acid synthase
VLLQPTCPFRDSADVDAAIEAFEASNAETLISVSPAVQHPCDMVTVGRDGLTRAVEPFVGSGRQAFPDYMFLDGAIYIARSSFLRAKKLFWNANSATHLISPMHGLDIDDGYQLRLARGLLATR